MRNHRLLTTQVNIFFSPDLFADKFISPTNSRMTLRSRARVDEFTIYIAYLCDSKAIIRVQKIIIYYPDSCQKIYFDKSTIS